MSDETKIFTKNDKNGDKCASGGPESGLKLIFERGVAILVRPWRFPGQPKKFVFFSIKVGTINSGTSLDSREQFKKTGKLEFYFIQHKTIKEEQKCSKNQCWSLSPESSCFNSQRVEHSSMVNAKESRLHPRLIRLFWSSTAAVFSSESSPESWLS